MKRLFRVGQSVIALLTVLVLFVSFYLQYAKDLAPCPLCLMQRGMMFGLLFFALMGLLAFTRRRARGLVFFELLVASGGLFFASRQLWLQAQPPADTGMCLPGIELLIHKLPWQDLLHTFAWGGRTGCGEVDWTFAGLSMPAWSAFYFSMMGLIALFFLIGLFRNDSVSH